MTLDEFSLKMATDRLAWCKEEYKNCQWVNGDSNFKNLMRGGRLLVVMDEAREARETIRRIERESFVESFW